MPTEVREGHDKYKEKLDVPKHLDNFQKTNNRRQEKNNEVE